MNCDSFDKESMIKTSDIYLYVYRSAEYIVMKV